MTDGTDILCLGIDLPMIRIGLYRIFLPLTGKGYINAMSHGAGIISWEGHGLDQDSLFICQYPVSKYTTTMFVL